MEKKSSAHQESPNLDDYSYTTLQLGVWRVLVHRDSESFTAGLSLPWNKWKELEDLAPMIWRFLREIWTLDPALVLLAFVLRLGTGLQGICMLYASSLLLRTVEAGLTSGAPDVNAILWAVFVRIICSVVFTLAHWAAQRLNPMLQTRIILHFEEYMLRETLRLDLPTSEDKNTEPTVSAAQLWHAFGFLTGLCERVFQLTSQIIFTYQQDSVGIIFTFISLVSPVLLTKVGRGFWMQACVTYSDNVSYLRIRALSLLASKTYREDVIGGNIGAWIAAEYKKARTDLGNVSDVDPMIQYGSYRSPIPDILMDLSRLLPTFYWAASAILQPTGLTVTSFAILQQHAQTLNFTVQMIWRDSSRAAHCFSNIKQLYSLADVQNKLVDGAQAYPNSTLSSDKGMSFELKDVSFAYPGGKSKENALKNVSLRIPAGSLVVIVGPNGSGKSTLIKLLNRLYDVDSGEIFVDRLPIKDYRLSDLRRVQASLTQDHKLYPLTLAENIGLGYPECVDDMEMVMQAAEAGGSTEVVSKLNEGVQTVLAPINTAHGANLDKDKHRKLKQILEGLEKKAEVSGGEKQRLVASRTFMRFLSGQIRFAVADEPTSALDPKAEHQLFKRLRESGEGKTLIFVTHRFGHLVKHADLIICMKDGQAVELGTHKELMARGGEYSELYNVQAQAFSDTASLQDI
ncbi:P-loop containing nucleoside triphosphate hydrolase protein [Mycena latifolia]|nr:P-loop containing nucleoside triphosphate hydrolase protein [Mycena latifolia]